ncbi:MAG: hypothetical protein ACRDLL_13005 [Solirubrobacterales bacterium]
MAGKLTEARAEAIVEVVRLGATRERAAQKVDVDPRTLHKWLERGDAAASPKVYRDLARGVHNAEADAARDPLTAGGHHVDTLLLAYRLRSATQRLDDGETGYFQTRQDQCLQAAVATVLQVPLKRVPDAHVDAQRRVGKDPEDIVRMKVAQLQRWAGRRGLRIVISGDPPLEHKRWIGLIPYPDIPFGDHLLVMAGDRPYFNPEAAQMTMRNQLRLGRDLAPRAVYQSPERIEFGVAFERR